VNPYAPINPPEFWLVECRECEVEMTKQELAEHECDPEMNDYLHALIEQDVPDDLPY